MGLLGGARIFDIKPQLFPAQMHTLNEMVPAGCKSHRADAVEFKTIEMETRTLFCSHLVDRDHSA